jgi:hypothetical protein
LAFLPSASVSGPGTSIETRSASSRVQGCPAHDRLLVEADEVLRAREAVGGVDQVDM